MDDMLASAMSDVYASLGALARNIEAIDAQIAELQVQRAEVEIQVRALALQLVGPTPSAPSSQAGATQLTLISPSDLPKRQLRLLKILADKPGLDSAAIAKNIYGNADKASRINVSSEFSRLKAGDYVRPLTRGIFELTEKGKAVLR